MDLVVCVVGGWMEGFSDCCPEQPTFADFFLPPLSHPPAHFAQYISRVIPSATRCHQSNNPKKRSDTTFFLFPLSIFIEDLNGPLYVTSVHNLPQYRSVTFFHVYIEKSKDSLPKRHSSFTSLRRHWHRLSLASGDITEKLPDPFHAFR